MGEQPGAVGYPFLKGHGIRNDFVILPDPDGSVHGDLPLERVRALCDRRAGIGGDGVLRVVRRPEAEGGRWFMDYRNADGSLAEMCGNGIRVFGRYLAQAGLVDPATAVEVDTRDGVKVLTFSGGAADGEITVDMGVPRLLGPTEVGVGERRYDALGVDVGNPHAVAFVDDLAEAGTLREAPWHDPAFFPAGVNVEFVVRRGEHHVAMRVHERGSGETEACGTGACAVMVAVAEADGTPPEVDYRIDLLGGTLTIRRTAAGHVLMTGPAVVVAGGTTGL
ncbi:diaminopimelate epimerase [Nocardioides sp.]|uniref:diaminopimelate epimerase n=1 Tax=Nocardioides sp. TaxID=35761 RepID=UPI003518C088